MSHRRILKSPNRWTIRETGSGRDIAHVPIVQLFEALEPSERLARQIKYLPAIIDHLRHRSFHGDQEAQRLLDEIEPAAKV